jgi:hypothetical protein
MVQGAPSSAAGRTSYRDGLLTGVPVLVSLALVLVLGLHIPLPLETLLREAAQFLGEGP